MASINRGPHSIPVVVASIFSLALLVRLIFVSKFHQDPISDQIWNDAVGWNLAEGIGFTARQAPPYTPGIFRSPGYPFFLAVLYKIFGHSVTAAFVAQALLDSATAVLTFMVAAEFAPVPTALLAGGLYALYPYPAIFSGSLGQDILLTFCFMINIVLLVRARKEVNASWPWIRLGLALGLMALVKPFLAIFSVVITVAIFASAESPGRKFAHLALTGGACAIVLLPWVIRNYEEFHSFPPLAVGGTGTNLMMVVEQIDGGDYEPVRTARSRRLAEEASLKARVGGGRAGQLSRDEYLNSIPDGQELIDKERELSIQARKELHVRWRGYLLLIARHCWRLWVSQYDVFASGAVAGAGQLLSWMVLVPGLIGMMLLRKNFKLLLPLYLSIFIITLSYAPYSVEARYTLPLRPLMIIFVAAFLIALPPFASWARGFSVRER